MWGLIFAYAIDHGDPTALHARAHLAAVARHEAAAHLASAWREASIAEELMRGSKTAAAQALRNEIKTRRDQLDARAAWVRLDVKVIDPDTIVVQQDGVAMPRALWGQPMRIDGGTHVWTAQLEGREVWRYESAIVAERQLLVVSPVLSLPPSDEPPPEACTTGPACSPARRP